MYSVKSRYLILTAIFFFRKFLFVDGHGMCARNVKDDLESSRYYKSFMDLDTIGLLQCIKICKRYKLCEKIHHNREQLTCNLMTRYPKEGDMTSLLDVQSVLIDSSNCLRGSCSETEVCVNRRDGSHICLDQGLCPTADWVYFNLKCYFFSRSEKMGDESVVFCDSLNATLVKIDNTEVNTFLLSEMTRRGMRHIWLAANDRAMEGEWVWGPGDKVLNTVWGPNEPNNYNNEACVVLDGVSETWHDRRCAIYNTIAYSVCEVGF